MTYFARSLMETTVETSFLFIYLFYEMLCIITRTSIAIKSINKSNLKSFQYNLVPKDKSACSWRITQLE